MIKREQLDDLIYVGRMARRFTQDSPILPDVWMEYGRRPGQGLELLITPHTEVGPRNTSSGELSVVVRERLRIERDRGPTKGYELAAAKRSPIHVAYNISTVMTELWFDELIRVVLPLCKPLTAVLTLFIVVYRWTDFAWPLIVLKSPHDYTITVGLLYLHDDGAMRQAKYFGQNHAGLAIA